MKTLPTFTFKIINKVFESEPETKSRLLKF